MDVSSTLIGAGLALAGSILGTFLAELFRAKYASQVRRGELQGERREDADRLAYKLAKQAMSLFDAAEVNRLKALFSGAEEWYWDHRLYLAEGFANAWLEARNTVSTLSSGEQLPDELRESIRCATKAIYERTGHKALTASSRTHRQSRSAQPAGPSSGPRTGSPGKGVAGA